MHALNSPDIGNDETRSLFAGSVVEVDPRTKNLEIMIQSVKMANHILRGRLIAYRGLSVNPSINWVKGLQTGLGGQREAIDYYIA